MSFAVIMVYVDNGSDAVARIKLACGIAQAFKATIIGASASMPALPEMVPPRLASMSGSSLAPRQEVVEAELGYLEVLFRKTAAACKCPLEWRSSLDHPARFLAREGRAADLIIVGQMRNEVAPFSLVNPSDVLLEVGRPILVVPHAMRGGPLPSRAVVAWKDDRRARRAVCDAIPLLLRSDRVDVIEIAPAADCDAARTRASDVALYLSRHGVAATGEALATDGQSPTAQLLMAARQRDAGLIVMGGKSHVRLREWTFGSDTYYMLKKSSVCVLLSG